MFPGMNNCDDREFCPYCLRDRGMLETLGLVRVPNPRYDPEAKPVREGLFVTSPPAETREKMILKKDSNGDTVHACTHCHAEVPPHLRLDLFHLVVVALTCIDSELRKTGGAKIIEILEDAKKAQDEARPDPIRSIMEMMGFGRTAFIDESSDMSEPAEAGEDGVNE